MIVDGINQLFYAVLSSFTSIFQFAPSVDMPNLNTLHGIVTDSSVFLGLRWLAWLLPVHDFLVIISSWFTCVLVFSIALFFWNNFKDLR